MNTTRIMHSNSSSTSTVATISTRAASAPRKAARPVPTTLWRSAVALVDHPSDAPPQ